MKLSIGIVGLPNVGKSTLFNAITNSSVSAENYPFCTIEPNSGIVPVPDKRLHTLAGISGSDDILFATIEFTDIAGIVKGASRGEGLGNKFLANIRETSAIVHMVRCFDDPDTIHVNGKVDPLDDVATINLELIMADLETMEKMIPNQQRKAKTGPKEDKAKLAAMEKIKAMLEQEKPARLADLSDDEKALCNDIHLLTNKKVIYVANISEDLIGQEDNDHVTSLRDYAAAYNDEVLVLCATLESEIAALDDEDKKEFLESYGLEEAGLHRLAQSSFKLLDLQIYMTTGPKETRAWTIPVGATAPKAAGEIHTDFEKGFIRASVISLADFVDNNGWKAAKDKGLVRQEGKDYIMQENDIVEFLFNV